MRQQPPCSATSASNRSGDSPYSVLRLQARSRARAFAGSALRRLRFASRVSALSRILLSRLCCLVYALWHALHQQGDDLYDSPSPIGLWHLLQDFKLRESHRRRENDTARSYPLPKSWHSAQPCSRCRHQHRDHHRACRWSSRGPDRRYPHCWRHRSP